MGKQLNEDEQYLNHMRNTDAFLGVFNVDETLGPVGVIHVGEHRSAIRVVDNSEQGSGGGCSKQNRPTLLEYFIDIRLVLSKTLKNKSLLARVENLYVHELEEKPLNPREKTLVQQTVGAALRKYSLWPTSAYFLVIKHNNANKLDKPRQ